MDEESAHAHGTVICDYCGKPAVQVTGATIYPHRPDLYDRLFWQCAPCDAYVGCHVKNPSKGFKGGEPMGRLAKADLRQAKKDAHSAFDHIWKERYMNRSQAYDWLSRKLRIPIAECHIGMMDVAGCKRVIEVCTLWRLERLNRRAA